MLAGGADAAILPSGVGGFIACKALCCPRKAQQDMKQSSAPRQGCLHGIEASECKRSAAEHVRRGDADLMLAGGADAAIIPSGMGGFIACKALSRRNEEPERASRPWDQGRDGFVMGEGAGERLPHTACLRHASGVRLKKLRRRQAPCKDVAGHLHASWCLSSWSTHTPGARRSWELSMLRASDLRHSRQACHNDGAMVHMQACWCWRSWSKSNASLVILHGMQAERAHFSNGLAPAGVLVLEELEHARAQARR